MKLIRANSPQIEAFKWEGEFTKELKMMLARHSYSEHGLLARSLKNGNVIEGCYLVFDGYKDYSILSEQEVKQKYEVLK